MLLPHSGWSRVIEKMSVSCAHILSQREMDRDSWKTLSSGHAGAVDIRVSRNMLGWQEHHSFLRTHTLLQVHRHTPYNSNTCLLCVHLLCVGAQYCAHMLKHSLASVCRQCRTQKSAHPPLWLRSPRLSGAQLSPVSGCLPAPQHSAVGSEQKGKTLILQLAAIASIWEPQNDFTSWGEHLHASGLKF